MAEDGHPARGASVQLPERDQRALLGEEAVFRTVTAADSVHVVVAAPGYVSQDLWISATHIVVLARR
jgi:hypothetical protein